MSLKSLYKAFTTTFVVQRREVWDTLAAASLCKKNRKPKEWRDKTEISVEQEVAGVPSEFLEAFRKRFLQSVAPSGNGNGH